MTLKARLKNAIRPTARRILDAVARRATAMLARSPEFQQNDVRGGPAFEAELLAIARALAASGDHRLVTPTETGPRKPAENVRIGYFGNIANNAYQYVKCMRRLGRDAELVVEDGYFDTYVMNRPFWEDLKVECDSPEDALRFERSWCQPTYVRRTCYDQRLQAKYQGRYSAIPEVQALYHATFGKELAADLALLLAQQMGHWPYLATMARYDVIQLSGMPIGLGPFCPRPYIVYPTGSDLFTVPFEETWTALLVRAGYIRATHVIYAGSNYPSYLSRLRISAPCTYAPAMMDTETFSPGAADATRDNWRRAVGGSRFVLGVCRQNWRWKGNDTLIRGFAAHVRRGNIGDWRLVLQSWGPDVEQSRKLIDELGITPLVVWEKLCSRPVLIDRQRAAELVVDQFAMEGYGTSVLESMCAGRPVMLRYRDQEMSGCTAEPPPFLAAESPEDISRVLSDLESIVRTGPASRHWVVRYHGYEQNVRNNYLPYLTAAALHGTTDRLLTAEDEVQVDDRPSQTLRFRCGLRRDTRSLPAIRRP